MKERYNNGLEGMFWKNFSNKLSKVSNNYVPIHDSKF